MEAALVEEVPYLFNDLLYILSKTSLFVNGTKTKMNACSPIKIFPATTLSV